MNENEILADYSDHQEDLETLEESVSTPSAQAEVMENADGVPYEESSLAESADTMSDEAKKSTPDEEDDPVATLRAEIEQLRSELEAARLQNEKTAAEVGEFHTLFPECSLSSIPDTVWDQVKEGIPLAASYALYEKKREAAARRAAAVNLENAKRSAGIAGQDAPAEYFTPDEVRAMSPSQVRQHYTKILESMQSWNR